MINPCNSDVIDQTTGAGLASAELRAARPDVVRYSQLSYEALLSPADFGEFPLALRAAVAARVARLNGDMALAGHYGAMLIERGETADLKVLSDPFLQDALLGQLGMMARHIDLIATHPKDATRRDIEALQSAGLSEHLIVTLSQIVAFVSFQLRVTAGLRLLGMS